jgi:osmoprotectant transport system permease protein
VLFSARRYLIGAVSVSLLAAAPALSATIDLADSGTPTSRLVADMEAIALARSGHTVTRTSIATASEAQSRLANGTIDAYVADTARLVEQVYGAGQRRSESDMRAVIAARSAARGTAAIGLSPVDDAPAVACRRRIVMAYRISGLIALPAAAPSLAYGATPSHMLRADGYWALRSTFRRVVVRTGSARYSLIATKRLDCVQSSVAEPRASRLSLVTLRDTRRRLAGTPRRTVTVVANSTLANVPGMRTTVDLIAGKITKTSLIKLRGAVEIDGKASSTVARDFLVASGVIAPN